MPSIHNHKNKIIFEKSYPGGWVKKLVERTDFRQHRPDPYLISPNGTKFRSNKELLDFIINHPEYWNTFDPLKINVECTQEIVTKPAHGTRQILDFLKNIRSGMYFTNVSDFVSFTIQNMCNSLFFNFRHDSS